MILGLSFVLAASFVGNTFAAEKGPTETVLEGCQKEFETYCKNVTPGESRLLACLYAYEDKLSLRCDYALSEASIRLQRALNSLSYLANECRDDLKAYCSAVQPGAGRLLTCLDVNQEKLGQRCKNALEDLAIRK
jgi:hypothetical protein